MLNEATSSLDSVSGNHVKKMMALLREQQKTFIVITHRSSSLNHADKIIVIDKGLVVDQGIRPELKCNLC